MPAKEGEVTDALPVACTVLELDRRALAHISASDASSLARAFRQRLSRSPTRRNWARFHEEESRERRSLLRQVKELGMSSTIDNSTARDNNTAEVDDEVPARALAEWSLNLPPSGRVENPDQDGEISGDSQWGGASGPSFVADISDTNILPPELLTAGSIGRLDDTVDRLSPKEIRLAATMLRDSTILTDSATPADRLTGQTGTDDSIARTAYSANRRSISPVAGPGTYRGRGVQGSSETPYVGRQIGTPTESTGKSWDRDSSLPPVSAPPVRPPPSEPGKSMRALQSTINEGAKPRKRRQHRFAGYTVGIASVASAGPEVGAPMIMQNDGPDLQTGSEKLSDTARRATETPLIHDPTATANPISDLPIGADLTPVIEVDTASMHEGRSSRRRPASDVFDYSKRDLALRPGSPYLSDPGYWSEPDDRVVIPVTVPRPTPIVIGATELMDPIYHRRRFDAGRLYVDWESWNPRSFDDFELRPDMIGREDTTWSEMKGWLQEHGHEQGNARKYSTRPEPFTHALIPSLEFSQAFMSDNWNEFFRSREDDRQRDVGSSDSQRRFGRDAK